MAMTTFLVISYLAGIVAILHAAVQPASAWANADRRRSYWLAMLATLTLFAVGVVAAIVYFVGVFPRLVRMNAVVDSPFRKQR